MNIFLLVHELPNPKLGGGNIAIWETIKALQHYPLNLYLCVRQDQCVDEFKIDQHYPNTTLLPYHHLEDLLSTIESFKVDVFHISPRGSYYEILQYCFMKRIPTLLEIKHPSISPMNLRDLIVQGTYRGIKEIPNLNKLKKAAHFATKIVVPSQYSKKQVNKQFSISLDRIEVLREGVNTDMFYYIPCEDKENPPKIFNFLSVGRLEWDKRIDMLLEVFAEIHTSYPNTSLAIAGEGSEKSKLIDYCKKLKLESKVTFLGSLKYDEMIKQYRKCHALIHTSRRESFCMVAAEAMACGIPCIVANVGAVAELIDDHKNGFLANNQEDFVRLGKYLIEYPDVTNEVGKRANLEIKENYSWTKKAGNFWNIYSKMKA